MLVKSFAADAVMPFATDSTTPADKGNTVAEKVKPAVRPATEQEIEKHMAVKREILERVWRFADTTAE